jgi:hypothetical protein
MTVSINVGTGSWNAYHGKSQKKNIKKDTKSSSALITYLQLAYWPEIIKVPKSQKLQYIQVNQKTCTNLGTN